MLQYKANETNTSSSNKQRKRKIIWFNPPFSKNVSTNVGKYFLKLLDKHFPKRHPYQKIFNRNTVKVSYSCMPNIKSIVSGHNKSILNEYPENNKTCNCMNKELCPLDNKCLTDNIVYEATITSNQAEYGPRTYIGISETTFKKRFSNHVKSFNHEKYEKDSELSKEVWKLKRQNQVPKITWKIRKKCKPFNPTSGKCDLCLNEKLFILELFDEVDLINKRDELVSKCRHLNKFKLNYKSDAKK